MSTATELALAKRLQKALLKDGVDAQQVHVKIHTANPRKES